ncbi:hypothetical protein [Bdellovibrio svalbardensis]|uniref:Uncharacterized protein n=1 Tax=Bdellovibrio svalbardensis TaxID=2972972 RepID=A0ABT6DSY3_9BACT|nr:hypothetical protein [Bdellovibrio svalbardensis]MDG0818268.1 hypothetical protein [Bdellovibrio svalbardensis]
MRNILWAALFIITFSTATFAQQNPVEAQKDINLTQNFGVVPVGTSTSLHWNLRAKELDLQIQSISLQGNGFILDSDCPEILPAKQKCKVGITFAPEQTGPHQAQLIVDLYSERFIFNLQGEGK